MTEDEFKSELEKLSPRLAAAGGPAGSGQPLGNIAKAFTSSTDLGAALGVLQADQNKLSSFETLVASIPAAAGRAPAADAPPPPTITEIQSQLAYMWVGPVISGAVIIGFFAMLYFLLTHAATLSNVSNVENVLFTLLGALGAAFTQVINYWLGSSKGSADKNLLIAPSITPRNQ